MELVEDTVSKSSPPIAIDEAPVDSTSPPIAIDWSPLAQVPPVLLSSVAPPIAIDWAIFLFGSPTFELAPIAIVFARPKK